jgi:hypothetical protein
MYVQDRLKRFTDERRVKKVLGSPRLFLSLKFGNLLEGFLSVQVYEVFGF